eukprot:COSAG01_NODE_67225_length_267_cov_1.946429_1_plen_61_part_10
MEDYDCGAILILLAHGVVVKCGGLLRQKYEDSPGKNGRKKLRIIVLLQAWDLPMHGPAACM